MLILVDALARAEGNAQLAERYWPQLTKWAEYLKEKGLDPENQLTTDDFAGHVAHNANLSIKAIEGLAAYADLAHLLKHENVAADYSAAAKSMAAEMGLDGRRRRSLQACIQQSRHLEPEIQPGVGSDSWLQLVPEKCARDRDGLLHDEDQPYGLPLDVRADYTKLDWSVWTATLASDPKAVQCDHRSHLQMDQRDAGPRSAFRLV